MLEQKSILQETAVAGIFQMELFWFSVGWKANSNVSRQLFDSQMQVIVSDVLRINLKLGMGSQLD